MISNSLISALLIALQLILASGIIRPDELYEMIDNIINVHLQNTCIIVSSVGGYTTNLYVPTAYLSPYKSDNNDTDDLNEEMMYKETILVPALEIGCSGFVIQAKNPEKQLQLIEETFIMVTQRNRKKFIILPIVKTVHTSKTIDNQELGLENLDHHSILNQKALAYITDLVFTILNNNNNEIYLRTHRFGGSDQAGHDEIHLDTYNVGEKKFRRQVDLFPDKVKDLQGKIFKVALFHYPPYAVIQSNYSSSNSGIDGMEWRLAVEYAKLHNCSLKPVVLPDSAWGIIYANRTGDGVLGAIVNDDVDLGITALYTWYEDFLYLDLSTAYIRTGITCLVPAPAQLPRWMSPILPFAMNLWMSIVCMMIFSIIVMDIINLIRHKIYFDNGNKRLTIGESALMIAGVVLQQGVRKISAVSTRSALSLGLLFVSLIIAAAYGGGLTSALTVPRYVKPIDTPSDMISNQLLWGATDDAWIFSIQQAEEPEFVQIVRNFQKCKPSVLEKKSREGKWGFAIERLQNGQYGIQDYLPFDAVEKMHLMMNDIYFEYCVAMLRKSSPFTESYSRRMLEVLASGISAYWEHDVVLLHLDYQMQLAIRGAHTENNDPVKLTMDHLQGIFFILIFGLLSSVFKFICEICYPKKRLRVSDE